MTNSLDLFPREQVAGVFRGFQEGGLEFHADLVLPYRNEYQNIPMHGQFVLVQLETPDEAVLGRIASFSSDGRLATGAGEEFNIRAVQENRPVPEDLRQQYLKYRVNIRVLGVLRKRGEKLTFVASHRRLPHVGSPVAFPSDAVLRDIVGHNTEGVEIGHFALGEYVYASGNGKFVTQDWMQVKSPEIKVRFAIDSLVSRRSFIFARAGFGKSNLNKLLFSMLYSKTPTVTKRGERQVPVGTVIFDPDGEYFWPDDKGRPGLCDVPHLADKLVVFTSRHSQSPFYQSFVAGGIKVDIRRFKPADVIGIALDPERQEQQNVRKLKGLSPQKWEELVNLIDREGNALLIEDVCRLLDLDPAKQEAEATAARSNMTTIVRTLHDKSSRLMDSLFQALSLGKLCVVDVSQLRGSQALILSGLILRRIFDRNQEEFTKAESRTIPTIAVIEEAQSVLNGTTTSTEPYISWVKEGRKYDLGAMLVTQQPASIPTEILSQGDNWFIFHLLSAADLISLKKANAHFSDDLLSVLLNEPIPGQGVIWSSVKGKPYPISVRVASFEQQFRQLDEAYNRQAANTFAAQLKAQFQQELEEAVATLPEASSPTESLHAGTDSEQDAVVDVMERYETRAIEALRSDSDLMQPLKGEGVAWGTLKGFLKDQLPASVDGADELAYRMVQKALDRILGPQNTHWHSFKKANKSGKPITYVKAGPKTDAASGT